MKQKILVVDDEMRLRKLVHDFLVRADYDVLEASDGEEALDAFYANKDLSLIILDVMMPRVNGYDVLAEIRQESDIPVIMLTAKGEEDDELKGFSTGADEYISKPFSPKVLVARVKAVLKRSGGGDATEDSEVSVGGIELSVDAHEVRIDGQRIDLSVKEFELLEYFIKNRGLALSREKILSSVWDYDYFGDARTIDTHVKKLRSKMGDKGAYIKTIWGMGYKFEIEE
ncbi:MAG: response regulator transcription factor [Lachnospiraceae bacterium]|nr:response regulator transcription factor [Lachnospiraceae bacterium]